MPEEDLTNPRHFDVPPWPQLGKHESLIAGRRSMMRAELDQLLSLRRAVYLANNSALCAPKGSTGYNGSPTFCSGQFLTTLPCHREAVPSLWLFVWQLHASNDRLQLSVILPFTVHSVRPFNFKIRAHQA